MRSRRAIAPLLSPISFKATTCRSRRLSLSTPRISMFTLRPRLSGNDGSVPRVPSGGTPRGRTEELSTDCGQYVDKSGTKGGHLVVLLLTRDPCPHKKPVYSHDGRKTRKPGRRRRYAGAVCAKPSKQNSSILWVARAPRAGVA